MAVTLTAEDYQQLALDITTRHASDVDRQAFYDAFLNAGNASNAVIIARTNTELGTAYTNLDDAIYALAAAGFRQTFLQHYDANLLALGKLANNGVGYGSWELAQAGLLAYAEARIAAEAAAQAAAEATASADATAKVNADKAAFLAGVNALTGGAAASYEQAVANMRTFIVNQANGADGVADAAARFNADFAAQDAAVYAPLVARIIELGTGLDGFAHDAIAHTLTYGADVIDYSQELLEGEYAARTNTIANSMNAMVTTLQTVLALPTNNLGVNTIII